MAIKSVKVLTSGRNADYGEDGERNYTREFLVITDTLRIDAKQIIEAEGVPRIGDFYVTPTEADQGSLCRRKSVTEGEDKCLFVITCEFSTKTEGNEQDDPKDGEGKDPVARKPSISWGWEAFQRPFTEDLNGIPILNSVDMPFSPPPTIDDYRWTLTISRLENTYDLGRAERFANALNSQKFQGKAIGTWKAKPISATQVYENNKRYWRLRYSFQYRADGWQLKILDQGFYQKAAGLQGIDVILDNEGNPVSQAVLLDGSGSPLKNGQDPVFLAAPALNNGFKGGFVAYGLQNFGELGLPDPAN